MSEKAKLIRGDPPKIVFKKKGEPPKNGGKMQIFEIHCKIGCIFNVFSLFLSFTL